MPLRKSKIAPAFFIGLGGCGGAIVDELARKVKQEDSFENYQDLLHFFALDTDADDLSRLTWVDTAHKFVLSDFAKPEYVELKQGKLHAKADELFTQWWPDWYRPRDTRGKGAGQIRIESRLALYHHLENDHAKILETLEKAIRRAYDIHNPFRANKAARIYLYASLAGGTGSGGFATMAATVRRLLGGQRGHQIIGTFVLPNVFKSKGLPPNQLDKIMANGYSALQELELLQSASPTVAVEFHYDPDHPEHALLDRPLFDQIYLIEEKTSGGVVLADATEIYPAIADSAHAQIFSTILDKEGSTLDNDTRELMQLDEQTFTKSFGSFGISALVLPTSDILEFCALRLGAELLMAAVPGGGAALGDGADLESADEAFVRGFEAKAEQAAGSPGSDAEGFRRAIEWVHGGGTHGGEGAVTAFLRRCQEDVMRRIDSVVKLRGWDEAELATFEKDPERVQSETAAAFSALHGQLVKSEDAALEKARQAAAEVAGSRGALSIVEMEKGKGPTEARYFHAILRQAILGKQSETRKIYEGSLSFNDPRLQQDFQRKVEELKEAAPERLLEKLPGRENDYFEVAAGFAAWYRDVIGRLRSRIIAHAMLEFGQAVVKELDRKRTGSFHFFARVDRVHRLLEERASRLLKGGGHRHEGSDANRFVLDVEVLQDHRTDQRLWEHLYKRIVRPSDMQLGGALSRLAEIASEGGAEQDIQRRIVDELLHIASATLRPRICGNLDERGLLLDEELAFEAIILLAARRLEQSGDRLPPPGDAAWMEESKRVSAEQIAAYIADKIEHTADKCQPFLTLNAGAPLLPDKTFVVLHRGYHDALGDVLTSLGSLRVDKGQLLTGESPCEIVFYLARIGCPLHAVKSLVDYERRYLAVKEKEIAEGLKVAGLVKGVPQIPIHQDKNWEGAPDPETRLFRVSIEGVRQGDSKIAWAERMAKRRERSGEAAVASDDLCDFTVGLALGLIRYADDVPDAGGYSLQDPDLPADRSRLGRFRDQAFASYRGRVEMQKAWLRKSAAARIATMVEDRELGALRAIFDKHAAELEKLVKISDKPLLDHLFGEIEALAAFRKDKGL